MGNRRHIFKNLLLGILMLLSAGIFAQEEKLSRAQQLYRAQKYEQASHAVDSAIVHPQTSKDFVSWTTRAYIYYYMYIRTDKAKLESSLRDTVLISIRKSITLNPDSDYVNNNKKLLVNLAAHYFNIAKNLLQDSLNSDRSLVAYNRYKELSRLTDASSNADSKDVEYYLAVGSVYSELFNKDNNNTKAQGTAKVALLKVLEVQPDNPGANMNLGLLYFNQAVNLIKSMDEPASFEELDVIQDNVVKLAKQAEQFILRVYKNDPKNKKACVALFYIYRMLYDFPKSDEFKKKAEDLGEKFTDSTDDGKKENKPSNDK
jgi:tetratricopeptide (TPR) repeat protein